MRLASAAKLSYFPLVTAEAERIHRFLKLPPDECSVVDPCAGCGTALCDITASSSVRRYGIELDAYRAEKAAQVLDEVIQGDCFDVHAPVESFSLLYLNPPYQFEIGESGNRRMEQLFLGHTYRWLRPGGVLVLVIPLDRLYDCREVLNVHFKDKAVYRLTEAESVKYKQAVLFGVRRTRTEANRMTDEALGQAHRRLYQIICRPQEIPGLPDEADRTYVVPPSGPARMNYRGMPLDVVEDLLHESPAWRQAMRIPHAPGTEFRGRPLLPLNQGHLAILCTSGLLNGRFGRGRDLHVAHWQSAKQIDRHEDTQEDGTTEIRERERFSQRLTLLYADGRVALLSERKGEQRDEERTPSDGAAEVHETDSRHGDGRVDPA